MTRVIWCLDWDRPGSPYNGVGLVRVDGTLRPAARDSRGTVAAGHHQQPSRPCLRRTPVVLVRIDSAGEWPAVVDDGKELLPGDGAPWRIVAVREGVGAKYGILGKGRKEIVEAYGP